MKEDTMKKTAMILATILLSTFAQAADLYCGANIEKEPGSNVFNKLVFWEKMNVTKSFTNFLLADGTLIKNTDLTPEILNKIPDGTLALGVSFTEGRPNLFLAKVKRSNTNEIKFIDTAIASTLSGHEPFLMANGASIVCKQLPTQQ